jgi:hypothetical protein
MTIKRAVPVAPARGPETVAQPSDSDVRLGSGSGTYTHDVQAWLDRLPPGAQAFALAEAFPKIAERIAILDVDAAYAARYLTQLMIDQRGDRQGFPMEIGRELLRIRAHYAEMQGESDERGDVWGGHTLRPSVRR